MHNSARDEEKREVIVQAFSAALAITMRMISLVPS